jgi:lactose/cellobiose-specific phosphotransferase system IIC component
MKTFSGMDAASLGEHRWARSVRKAFLLTLPLVLSGALALLALNLPLPGYQNAMDGWWGPHWRPALENTWKACLGLLSISVVFATSHTLASLATVRQRIETSPVAIALVALACYFILTLPGKGLLGDGQSVPRGVFLSVLVGIAATEVFLFFRGFRGFNLAMLTEADSELPAILKSVLPGMFTISLFFALQYGLIAPFATSADHLTDRGIGWLFGLSEHALVRALIFTVVAHLLWFVGIHGNNALEPYYRDFLAPATDANIQARLAGHLPTEIVTNAFLDAFVLMGGAGATAGLLIALLLVARRGSQRRLAWLASLPAAFNINEILIFGLPIVLNPALLLPFLLAPLVCLLVAYAATAAGLVPLNAGLVTWTTPLGLNAWLATGSWRGVALQAFNLGLCIAIYTPFVRHAHRRQQGQARKAFAELIAAMEDILGNHGHRILDRPDEVGRLSRSLMARLDHDLRSGRLFLVYQPKLDLQERVIGVEALLRWPHPMLGNVPPHVAIGIIEDAGRINEVGCWILEVACHQLHAWRQAGLDGITMAVNLSPLQLEDPALLQHVERCLARYRLAPSDLELEITEGHRVSNSEGSGRNLAALNALGVRLAMDDFGMGYSSLLYMRRFRIDAIKLDGSLTREVTHNKSCREIIASVGQLCRGQQVRMIAEYVETEEQRDLLRSLGCNGFQGWLYSPALEADACRDYVEKNLAATREQAAG